MKLDKCQVYTTTITKNRKRDSPPKIQCPLLDIIMFTLKVVKETYIYYTEQGAVTNLYLCFYHCMILCNQFVSTNQTCCNTTITKIHIQQNHKIFSLVS